MFSHQKLARLFNTHQIEDMYNLVAAADFPDTPQVRVRFVSSHAAVFALALRRLVEMVYRPSALGQSLLDELLNLQQEDGSFDHDPLATAAAIAAFDAIEERGMRSDRQIVSPAKQRAVHAMKLMQDPSGLFGGEADRRDEDKALCSALICLLLGPTGSIHEAASFGELCNWFEDNDRSLPMVVAKAWYRAKSAVDTRSHQRSRQSSTPRPLASQAA